MDLYTYNDDVEIVSTKQLKYDASIPCEYFSRLNFFMEDEKFSLCIDGTSYIFDGKSGEKLAEYTYYGQETPIETHLGHKTFGYYLDVGVAIDEECNVSERPEDSKYSYSKINDDLYYDHSEDKYYNGDLEPITGFEDYRYIEYIGDGFYLLDGKYIAKPGEDIVLDMSDLSYCGSIGIFDDGSDNCFLIGDNSYLSWDGYHISIPKSKLVISEDELWNESETSHVFENNGVKAVIKDMNDPDFRKIACESYALNLDLNETLWHMAVLEGYVADFDHENNCCIITDKNGDIVYKRMIQEEH